MSIRSKIKKNLFAIISIGLALVVMTGFLLSNDGLARFGEIMRICRCIGLRLLCAPQWAPGCWKASCREYSAGG